MRALVLVGLNEDERNKEEEEEEEENHDLFINCCTGVIPALFFHS